MIFQTQLKHCFTKYECQLQGWVAWIQVSTWLVLHWTDWDLWCLPSSFICTEIFHENRDRDCETHGTSSSSWPSQQGRVKGNKFSPTVCESRARHFQPCSAEERGRGRSAPPLPCYLEQDPWSRGPGTWASAAGLGQYHMHQQHHWGTDPYKHQKTPNLIKKGTLREWAQKTKTSAAVFR